MYEATARISHLSSKPPFLRVELLNFEAVVVVSNFSLMMGLEDDPASFWVSVSFQVRAVKLQVDIYSSWWFQPL